MNEEMRTIARERENAPFDVRELTHVIYGGPQATALKVLMQDQNILKIIKAYLFTFATLNSNIWPSAIQHSLIMYLFSYYYIIIKYL